VANAEADVLARFVDYRPSVIDGAGAAMRKRDARSLNWRIGDRPPLLGTLTGGRPPGRIVPDPFQGACDDNLQISGIEADSAMAIAAACCGMPMHC
jgi:hypothetical protein